MKTSQKFLLAIGVTLAIIAVVVFILFQVDAPVLHPAGEVGKKQQGLLLFTTLLAMVVVIPVFVMTFWIAWRYRADNHKATYKPDWDTHKVLETIWWGIPCAIILVLGTVTWVSSHELDPYVPLKSSTPPVNVQVVALPWKWLFLYPDQGVASVNELYIPEQTPINFTITSDAPMNSFWIPALGSQIYAMSGMSTKLHLVADRTGVFEGSSANISGDGFAGMRFKVHSVDDKAFGDWYTAAQQSTESLDLTSYAALAVAGSKAPATTFRLNEPNLYNDIVMKYMMPSSTTEHAHQANQGGAY